MDDIIGLTHVGSNYIFFWNDGVYDRSRWISISHRGGNSCLLHLADLCQPGKLSKLSSIQCPTAYVKNAVERGGSLQLTLAGGYVLIQRLDERVILEFRGREDHATTKASFKAQDFIAGIAALDEASQVALTV